MNCRDVSQFAPLYLAGELESGQAESFRQHLNTCSDCRREITRQAVVDDQVRRNVLAEPVDSAAIDQYVRQAIRADRARHWMLAAAGIAAVLLVSLFGYRRVFSAPPPPLFAAAAKDHRVEIVEGQPRRWRTDLSSILELAKRQSISEATVTAFIPAGYHLAQGRLCLLDGRLYLHLVYRDAAGNFSLFLRPADPSTVAAGNTIRTGTFAAEQVAGFEHPRVSALIVTRQAGSAARRLAESAAAVL